MGRRIAQPDLANARKWPEGILVRSQMGGIHTSKWPRKRGPSKDPEQIDRTTAFKMAVDMIRRPQTDQLATAQELTKLAPALARDILLAACYGQFLTWHDASGLLWTGVPTPSSPIQRLLDGITQTPGSIIARSPQGWAPLNPGDPGDVLYYIGPPDYFAWDVIPPAVVFNPRGPHDPNAAYAVGDIVTSAGRAWCCYVAIAAPVANLLAFDAAAGLGMTISTTNTPNDTATSLAVSNAFAVVTAAPKSAGKLYFECEGSSLADSGTQFGAACGITGSLSQQAAYGEFNHNAGSVLSGGGSGGWNGWLNNKRSGFAFAPDFNHLWYSDDVTASPITWNTSTTYDPGADIGGYNIGTLPGDAYPYMYSQGTAGQQIVLFSDPADFLIPAIPTGYSPWQATSGNPPPASDDAHWF